MKLSIIPFWIATAFRFLIRSARYTFLLSSMVLIAVSALVFLSSMAVGVNDAMVRNSVSLYTGHIYASSLAANVQPDELKIEGVAGVAPRVERRGVLKSGEGMETVYVVGITPSIEKKNSALHKKGIAGKYPKEGERSIYIGPFTADSLRLSSGSIIKLIAENGTPVELTVAGIYKTGVDKLDRGIVFTPAGNIDNTGGEWSAALFLDKGVEAEGVAAELNRKFGGAKFETWAELMPDLAQLIDLNYVSMSIVIFIVFFVVAVGVSCAVGIFIIKNMREYGLMKAMGVTPAETAFFISAEVTMMNVAASLIGVALGVVMVAIFARHGVDLTAFTSHNKFFAVSGVVYPRLTAFSLIAPPAVSITFGLLAAIWPAGMVARKRAVEILRMS